MNPLYMADVLQNIFSYFTEKELFRVRLICSDWEIQAKSEIRKRCRATFKSNQDVQEYIKLFSSNPTIHEKFAFIQPNKNHGIYEYFFLTFGQHIKSLEITSGDFLNYYTASIEKHCPVLEELYLLIPTKLERKKNVQTLFPLRCQSLKVLLIPLPFSTTEFFEQIVQSVEKLTKLQIGSESSAPHGLDGTAQIDLLTQYIQYPCFLNLEILNIALFLTDHCWIVLAQCGFRLQEFTTGMSGGVQTASVRKFLEAQKETLVKLVTVHRKSSFEPKSFPIMPHVKSLHIAYGGGTVYELISKFPNLVDLELKNYCPHPLDLEWVENEDQSGIMNSVKSLRLNVSRKFDREIWPVGLTPVLSQFGQLLSGLKILQVGTRDWTNSDMQAVFKHMQNLEYIAIVQLERLKVYEMSDECFTSIETLTGEKCYSFQNLKNLKTLILSESCNITDAAITRGLSNCTNLQNLSISSRIFTGQALTSIANNLKNLQTLHIGFRYELVTLKAVKYLTQMLSPNTKIRCTQFCSRRPHNFP